MWIADKITYRGKDTYIKAYKGNELVWEKTTPPTPVLDKYITFSVTNGVTTSIKTNTNPINSGTLYYSYDNNTWSRWSSYIRDLEIGTAGKETLYVRGKCSSGISDSSNKVTFLSTNANALLKIGGNIMGLIDYENPPMVIPNEKCFVELFKGLNIQTTSKNLLPAITLKNNCYESLFRNCTSIVDVPELPATTLAPYCYYHMFDGCTSLVTAPALPATTLVSNCYNSMFYDCKSLVNAPVLPATTLADRCYLWMFYNCTSLVTAPALPATTLANSCYYCMFFNCKTLVNAPVLPATTLVSNCYENMFYNCKNLQNITMLATYALDNALDDFASGVNSTGTLTVANGMASEFPRALSGLPNDWVIVEAS